MKKMSNVECRMSNRRSGAFSPFHSSFVIRYSSLLVVFCLQLHAATNTTNTASRNIGIEGKASLTLPRADYQPRPLDDRTELILRIEKVTALASNEHRYDFYYMGLEPGAYKLADFLIRPDGSRPDELGELLLHVRSMLPEDHEGKLNAYVPRLLPAIGGYRAFLGLLAGLWVGILLLYLFFTRKKRVIEPVVFAPPPPSFAERLRPLVEEAAAGKLNVEGQAHLERLLMGYWREKLNLPDMRMAEALTQLKSHRDAGELLRALERWLHRPGVVSAQEVGSLLQPYRNLPLPSPAADGGGP